MGFSTGNNFFDDLTGGSKGAQKANKGNLADIKKLFESLNLYGDTKYDEALKSIEGIGSASKNDALSQEKQYLASTTQGLQGLGLSGTTVGSAAARGIHSDTLRTLGGINESIARMRAGLLTGQAGFHQGNTFNLANILSGVNYQPGTNYLKEGADIAATIFSDRRLKRVLEKVGVACAYWDAKPFGIYRYEYLDRPEDGVFEGVIAQEVQHIPGVVSVGEGGFLMVDTVALKAATGVSVRRIGAEVAA